EGGRGAEGMAEPRAEGEPERLAAALAELGAESVAICLLFSYLDPTHERRLAEHLRTALPDLPAGASPPRLPSAGRSRSRSACSSSTSPRPTSAGSGSTCGPPSPTSTSPPRMR